MSKLDRRKSFNFSAPPGTIVKMEELSGSLKKLIKESELQIKRQSKE